MVGLSLAPLVMLAPLSSTFSLPFRTVNLTVDRLASASLTLKPVMALAVPLAAVCPTEGKLLTGAVLGANPACTL